MVPEQLNAELQKEKKNPPKQANKEETRSSMVIYLENFNVYKGQIFSFTN